MKRDISLTIARNAQRSTAQRSRSGNRPLLKDLLDRMFVNAQPLDRAICVFSAPGMHDGPYPIWLKYSISTGYIKLILLSQNVTNFGHKLQKPFSFWGKSPRPPVFVLTRPLQNPPTSKSLASPLTGRTSWRCSKWRMIFLPFQSFHELFEAGKKHEDILGRLTSKDVEWPTDGTNLTRISLTVKALMVSKTDWKKSKSTKSRGLTGSGVLRSHHTR